MGDLLLNNLEVRSFRGFRHLKIEHLGRVNLIVGKNNVGKSALLEALRLYASKGSPEVIWELLGIDEESKRFRRLPVERQLSVLKYLFYGRKEVQENPKPIQIGPIDSSEVRLTIGVGLDTLVTGDDYPIPGKLVPNFSVKIGSLPDRLFPLDKNILPELFWHQPQEVHFVFVSSKGLDKVQIAGLWDSIALTPLQEDVLGALRIIAPGVEGLNLVADVISSDRIPIVKVQGITEPLPLSNLGDGMQRMLGIALALVSAKDGMLLIDEIENGLHYSVQPSLWQIIFHLARHLNIQVFATSHSRDCIEAFQQIADADKQTEGMLIRLESKKDEIVATLFDERELGIATREQIEVR